ncbi:MAG: SRPBCC family protein [Pseudomonadota bacterium]
MLKGPIRIAAIAAGLMAAPLQAEVTRTTDAGFTTRDEAVVDATPKAVWLALISPADWWNSDHTWSGDSSNLSLTPQAGGCFCEKIPEVDEPDRFTLEGSVEHMRVIQAYPETALRMQGSLGPLQSEPVTGILTIAISKVDTGTRIVWEYNVGGEMRYEVPTISKAVDGVMSLQLAGLAEKLGRVDAPKADDAVNAGEETPEASSDPAEKPSEDTKQSVEDAFGDLSDE